MTDDQLDGRDLDRACGEAMGWTDFVVQAVAGMFGLPPIPLDETHGGRKRVPCYSTDPSTQAEKLAWLESCDFRFVEITMWDDGTCVAKGFGSPDHRLDREEQGTTIDQALARLVCRIGRKTE